MTINKVDFYKTAHAMMKYNNFMITSAIKYKPLKNKSMLKKYLLAHLFFLFACSFSMAQRSNVCGFIIPPKQALKSQFQSVYEAKEIVDEILDSVKWKENFRLQEKNGINNAYATIYNNTRWIVYDNDFLENLDDYANTKWASISVIAHEMGHHYYNHVVSGKGSTIPTEIEADYFSGYAMQKQGATLEQSVAAMKAIATDRASSTHPAKNDRLAAITRGWNAAKNAGNTTTTTNPVPPSTQTNPTTTQTNPKPTTPTQTNTGANTDPNTDPSWIGLKIQSTRNEIVYLSDDGKNYQEATIAAGQTFFLKFEIYEYGWLRMKYYNGYRIYKLFHGKDYNILWNRRTKNWSLVEIPE